MAATYLAAGDVDGELADVVEGAGLGEAVEGGVEAEGADVVHVDDGIGGVRHEGVEEGEGGEALERRRVFARSEQRRPQRERHSVFASLAFFGFSLFLTLKRKNNAK